MAKKAQPKVPETDPTFETRKLKDLWDHPLQTIYYVDPDYDARIAELAADIAVRGMMEPIHILPKNNAGLPPNTIISGHCRRDAMKLNGETQVDVLVRYDLAEADAVEVEAEFLKENQLRRHQTKLSQAKVALRLFEIEKGREPGELWYTERDEARDEVGKIIGMSGRNLQRYWRILKAPVEIQRAFETKELKLVPASQVANLCEEVQQEIAEKIRDGEDAKSVVENYLGTSSNHPKSRFANYRNYMKAIRDADKCLGPIIKDITFSPKPADVKLLKRVAQMNDRLAKKLQANEKRNEKRMINAIDKIIDLK